MVEKGPYKPPWLAPTKMLALPNLVILRLVIKTLVVPFDNLKDVKPNHLLYRCN